MTRLGLKLLTATLLVCLTGAPNMRADTISQSGTTPDFNEVRDLLRANLAGATDAELNRAAVEGLLTNLRGKAMIVGSEATHTDSTAPIIAKTSVLDDGVAYICVGRVDTGLAESLRSAYEQLSATNKLKGVALDLRFTDGDDYAAAAATADLFLAKQSRLLDWGNGMVESKTKTNAIVVPVAVLVNRETGGAAEALAAVLRETGAGLILGNTTAGRAMIMRDFPLKNGQLLRIATTSIKLGDGSSLTLAGMKPDIQVAVNTEDERIYYADAYADLAKTNQLAITGMSVTNQSNGTNRPSRKSRLSEADLVREKQHEEPGRPAEVGDEIPVRDTEPENPIIRDPALARAVDLLKGLAVVRQSHP